MTNPPFLYTYGPSYLTPLNGLPPMSAPDLSTAKPCIEGPVCSFSSECVDDHTIGDQGASSYNALQVSFARPLSHGLSVNADDIQDSTYSTSSTGLVPSQFSTYDYCNSDADLRNRFAMNAIYSFPFADAYHGLAGAVPKGWQLNGVAFWQMGQPFTVTNSAPQINEGPSVLGDRPDQLRKANVGNHSIANDFFTIAFAPQAFGTAGDERRNPLFGSHQRRVDLSLFREFPLFEAAKLQLRAEAYNVSNTPTFGAPNSSIGTQGFGTISSTLPGIGPRVYQFAAKVIF